MAHKRRHVRVPIAGEAILSNKQGIHAKTRTIDISPGGIGVINPSDSLDHADYEIEVTTEDGKVIQLTATLIYKDEKSTGFKLFDIDKKNVQLIADLVAEFQTTEEFIEQIDKHDLFDQYLTDHDGNEIAITFDVNPK